MSTDNLLMNLIVNHVEIHLVHNQKENSVENIFPAEKASRCFQNSKWLPIGEQAHHTCKSVVSEFSRYKI